MATRKKAKSKSRASKSKAPAKKTASKALKSAVKKTGKSAVKNSAKKAVQRTARKPGAKATNGNGRLRPSSMPWGQAGRALDGVRILDFTHVQSGRPARNCWPSWAPT
jgi:formyl-CoA transferase